MYFFGDVFYKIQDQRQSFDLGKPAPIITSKSRRQAEQVSDMMMGHMDSYKEHTREAELASQQQASDSLASLAKSRSTSLDPENSSSGGGGFASGVSSRPQLSLINAKLTFSGTGVAHDDSCHKSGAPPRGCSEDLLLAHVPRCKLTYFKILKLHLSMSLKDKLQTTRYL